MRYLVFAFFLFCLPVTSHAIDDPLEGEWFLFDPGNHITRLSFAQGKLTVSLQNTPQDARHFGFVASYTLKPGGIVHFVLDPVPNPISGPDGDYHYTLADTTDRDGHTWKNLRIPQLFGYDTSDPQVGIWFQHKSLAK